MDAEVTCIDCEAPAARASADGVPLCEGCYGHLCEQAVGVPGAWVKPEEAK